MTFALITEGPSEHRIIKHILQKCFKDYEPEINQVQPKITANKQDGPGGWNEVLQYCKRDIDLKNIFVENDFLIIQIDTDQSQISPFDISHTHPDNSEKATETLYADVVTKLIELLSSDILQEFGQRILFAVCIHTIECWLLPIYYTNNHKSATKSCIPKLNVELSRRNQTNIPTNTKDKNSHIATRAYDNILKAWKRKDIVNAAQHNAGFERFITALLAIEETLQPTDNNL